METLFKIGVIHHMYMLKAARACFDYTGKKAFLDYTGKINLLKVNFPV